MPARGLTKTDLVRLMSAGPADLTGIGWRKGRIAAGYDAVLVIFVPEAEIEVTADRLHTRHCISPYVGERLLGRVAVTYVRGREVFRDGEFTPEPFGVEV